METVGVEKVDELAAVAAVRARAEAVEWSSMLAFDEALRAEYAATESYFARQAQMASIALSIAAAMQLSEGQVHRKLGAARTLVEQAPTVWAAFADGLVDANRAVMIAAAVDKLQRPESVARLDAKVVTYARSHTSIQLKTWLATFVADTESDLFNERAAAEREQRRIEIDHRDDGMSWLMAYLPSHVVAAIDKRLTRDAKAMVDDPRTLAQRKADLFASYLTCNEAGELVIGADIAVLIGADTLVGESEPPPPQPTDHSSSPPSGSSTQPRTPSGTPSSPTRRPATSSNTTTRAASPPRSSTRPFASATAPARPPPAPNPPSTATTTTASPGPTDPPPATTCGPYAPDTTA